MSKKHKIKKKTISPIPGKSSESKPTSIPGPGKSNDSGITLIVFDKKTKLFLGILLFAYLLFSSLKLHTSNIGNWDTFWGLEKSEAVVAGTPRFIRMDEWMITDPAIMGQYEAGLPIKNEANGGGNAPVVFGLPIKDISSILRPSIWSYFIFDLERAYSFSWNFNIFFFLISMFLLFMLLTKNNFWLSVFGAFFIFLAPAVQWWSYTISNSMIYLNGMCISFIYLMYSKRRLSLIISSLILITSIFSFIASLYPPFQVPLIYLYLSVFIGYLIREKNFLQTKDKLALRSAVLAGALIILGVILLHYYMIAKETYSMMMNTVYPGKRFSTGGNLINGKLFADFFSMFLSDKDKTPTQWQNICEASGAILFFPVIFYALFFYFIKYKKTDSLLLSISVFVILTLVYVLVGFPAFLSKLTLFSMTPDFRTLPILGIGNCILLICYIGSSKIEIKKSQFSWIEFGILTVSTFIFIRIVSSHINVTTKNFFTASQVNIVTLLVILSYLLIRYKDYRFTKPALFVTLFSMVISNAGVNPLTKGLSPILDNPLAQASKQIHEKDPGAGWAVFGDDRLTHLIKANGANVLNGVKYVPPLDVMKVLDPEGKNDSIYNRYAWVKMKMYINWRDTVTFQKTFNDSYIIFMDPCSPRLKLLKVKYFVFDYKPQDAEVRCMTKVAETGGILIYKRTDE